MAGAGLREQRLRETAGRGLNRGGCSQPLGRGSGDRGGVGRTVTRGRRGTKSFSAFTRRLCGSAGNERGRTDLRSGDLQSGAAENAEEDAEKTKRRWPGAGRREQRLRETAGRGLNRGGCSQPLGRGSGDRGGSGARRLAGAEVQSPSLRFTRRLCGSAVNERGRPGLRSGDLQRGAAENAEEDAEKTKRQWRRQGGRTEIGGSSHSR